MSSHPGPTGTKANASSRTRGGASGIKDFYDTNVK
jgi:hypothetical protein